MKISSWLRAFSCPTYSPSVAGRSERSNCCSSLVAGRAEISRSVSIAIPRALCRRDFDRASAEAPQRADGHRGDAASSRQRAAVDDAPVVLHLAPQLDVAAQRELEADARRRPIAGLVRSDERATAFGFAVEPAELAVERKFGTERPGRNADRFP